MMVDSSATTGRPAATAAATSGWRRSADGATVGRPAATIPGWGAEGATTGRSALGEGEPLGARAFLRLRAALKAAVPVLAPQARSSASVRVNVRTDIFVFELVIHVNKFGLPYPANNKARLFLNSILTIYRLVCWYDSNF